MIDWKMLGRLLIGAALIFAGQLPSNPQAFAAEGPSLRVVYNALGGSMAPLWPDTG